MTIEKDRIDPNNAKISDIQAARLADMTGEPVTAGDNAWATTARFLVGWASDDGACVIGINAQNRAFNPAVGDAGPSSGGITMRPISGPTPGATSQSSTPELIIPAGSPYPAQLAGI